MNIEMLRKLHLNCTIMQYIFSKEKYTYLFIYSHLFFTKKSGRSPII